MEDLPCLHYWVECLKCVLFIPQHTGQHCLAVAEASQKGCFTSACTFFQMFLYIHILIYYKIACIIWPLGALIGAKVVSVKR